MAEKQISTNQLAKMIKAGFDNTPTKSQFENLDKEVDILKKDVSVIKKDVKDIKFKLDEAVSGINKLETRVDYIENVLAIKK